MVDLLGVWNRMYLSPHAITRVKCVTRVIMRDFLRFQKMDFYFLFIFQSQVTRATLTVSPSSERRNNAALSLQNHIAHFRDVQWRRIWCIVELKVDKNKNNGC